MEAFVATNVQAVFVGSVEDRWTGKPPSAIAKKRVDEPQEVALLGLVHDQQADLKVHGGPEKALHHYPLDHMDHWRRQFPESASKFKPGCFGENISSSGITEETLCLGDILRLGTVTVQVCQGRQPCWKLNMHLGIKNLALDFQTTGRTGWYYRVLEPGMVGPGDDISLLDRLHPDWSLARLIRHRFDKGIDAETARELAGCQTLSENWRRAFERKTVAGFVENTGPRLNPPEPS